MDHDTPPGVDAGEGELAVGRVSGLDRKGNGSNERGELRLVT